jgi:hypothetical protein
VRAADASGAASYGPGEILAISLTFGPGGQVLPGSTWNYLVWYRDPGSACGSEFNTTNGVSVLWF